MRPHCIFIACLVLFAFCSMARSESSQGPDMCCFSFSSIRIPVKQIESYQLTHLECNRSGIVFVTKGEKKICADPTQKWAQRLKSLVDARTTKDINSQSGSEEM